jgi:hypothetical protein
LYDGDESNFCRFEDSASAIQSGELLRQLWASHPNLHFVAAYEKLEEKQSAVRSLLDLLAQRG